jgi:hypothetical protein
MITGRSLPEEADLMKNPTAYRSTAMPNNHKAKHIIYCKSAKYTHSCTALQWEYVKRVFSYLKGTLDYCLQIKPSADFKISGFSVADWETNRRQKSGFRLLCIFGR